MFMRFTSNFSFICLFVCLFCCLISIIENERQHLIKPKPLVIILITALNINLSYTHNYTLYNIYVVYSAETNNYLIISNKLNYWKKSKKNMTI